ncbi:peptidoglycan hydrolase FlgJ [mine drainage metagenome]|uniref:Peptidoglycan hydrolase FlgJ n=1 Tax=mine drainage metagenome TaxID=410659 RepID=A0A1J5RZ18_9ZZZZ
MSTPDIANQFALDVNSLTALKSQARVNSPQAVKAAAQQFEALFLQQVLKAMRDATPHDGPFDSEQSRMYESLLDQQLAQVLAAKSGGTGLATMIEKQMAQQHPDPVPLGPLPLTPAAGPSFPLSPPAAGIPLSGLGDPPAAASVPAADDSVSASAREFVNRVWPQALEASQATGIPPHFMVAQAALETGWGRSEPRYPDGRKSFNLFGIKAGSGWTGPVVRATTSEVVGGVAQKRVASFRAYGSYAEAFRDYAHLLLSNPRYAGVVGSQDAASFSRGLQQAGYATDPMYAVKLARIIGGSTLRNSLVA